MRFILALAMIAACEKSGGVESTGRTSSTPREEPAPSNSRPRLVATLPNDAGVAAIADANPVVVDAKVAVRAPDVPSRRSDDVRMSEQEASRIAALLTGDDSGKPSPGDMSRRTPGSDLQGGNDLGRQVSVGGGEGRGTRGDGDPRPGTRGTGIGTAGPPGGSGSGSANPPGPSGRVSVSSKQAMDISTLTLDMVVAKIQSVYMAGLKRCYKNYLTKDASARGKVALTFTVTESGGTVSPRAISFANDVGDCMVNQIGGWRFPVPKDQDGEKTQATFSIGLALVPD